MSPNAGGGGVAGSQTTSTAVHRSPNKLRNLTPYLTCGNNHLHGHWTDTKIKIKSFTTCLFQLLKIDDDVAEDEERDDDYYMESDGDEKMRIENKDWKNYLFSPYHQAAIF